MTRTLAELRAEPRKARPTRSLTICLAPDLVAEVQSLVQQIEAIPALSVDEDGKPRNGDGSVRKMGQGEDTRGPEKRAQLAERLAEMAEYEGELRLEARRTDGEWRNWCNAHPAREEGEPAGHARDKEVAGGYCNADDLLEDLGTYAHLWNGDPFNEGEWDTLFKDSVANPDKKSIAQAVVSMYESRLDFRQWRSGLSETLTRLNVSDSPETSGSAADDSTAGSPEPSSEATTETATASP